MNNWEDILDIATNAMSEVFSKKILLILKDGSTKEISGIVNNNNGVVIDSRFGDVLDSIMSISFVLSDFLIVKNDISLIVINDIKYKIIKIKYEESFAKIFLGK